MIIKLSIEDREFWKQFCERVIANIKAARKRKREELLLRTKERSWIGKLFYNNSIRRIKPNQYDLELVNALGYATEKDAEILAVAVSDPNVKEVALDEDEYDRLTAWHDRSK